MHHTLQDSVILKNFLTEETNILSALAVKTFKINYKYKINSKNKFRDQKPLIYSTTDIANWEWSMFSIGQRLHIYTYW